MSDLPHGWSAARIRELCTLENGRAFKPTDWTDQGLPIVRIQNLNRSSASFNHFAGEVADRYRLRGGELLFAWSGTPGTSFGAHVWRGGNAVLNQHIFRVDFDESAVEKRFFRHAINQKLEELIDVAHGGVGLRHVTKGVFENTTVSLPPLPEQKRIADKLDALLARVDACRDRLDRVPGILKRFRQSVLAAATTGDLTRECRGEGEIRPAAYEACPLKDLVREPLRNGKSVRDGDGLRVLRLSSLRNGAIDWKEAKAGEWGDIDVERFLVEDGDFLVARGNGSRDLVGRGSLVLGTPPRVAFPDTMIRIRPDSKRIVPRFLKLVWDASGTRNQIEFSARTTAGIWKVAQPDLEAISIPLPVLHEQEEIVRRAEELFGFVDSLAVRCHAARSAMERLTPSVLTKAFRGELVPQGPNDEPASALLARIRGDRGNLGDATQKMRGGSNGNRGLVGTSKAEPKRGRALKEAATR